MKQRCQLEWHGTDTAGDWVTGTTIHHRQCRSIFEDYSNTYYPTPRVPNRI